MRPFHPLNTVDQLAEHLRTEIMAGSLSHLLPGVHKLAKSLGVSPKTVVAAVSKLEHDGLLKPQGSRKRNRIVTPSGQINGALKINILICEIYDRSAPHVIETQRQLEVAGHIANFASKTMLDLDRNVDRIAEFVAQNPADAWIVVSGSVEVLEWFAAQPAPAFALFGRRQGIAIAAGGPSKPPAMKTAVDHLIRLGHRRISMIVREERRTPHPGVNEQAFLDQLSDHGIKIGSYNLPSWEETPEGFKRCLDSLFQVTPPTALILDEGFFLTIAQYHLARKGIFAPNHVSLVCSDPDPTFSWYIPRVAHISWDSRPLIRRIVQWANNIKNGKIDKRQTITKAEFIEGGTIGPAPIS